MKNNLLKSTWAVFAGFLLVVILSIATDLLLTKAGVMKQPFDQNSTFFISLVVVYRSLYGIAGSFLTARLAPNRPMKHSLTGGMIGLVITTVGTIAMWDQPPHWYPISLIVTTLPCAWLGGWIFIKSKSK